MQIVQQKQSPRILKKIMITGITLMVLWSIGFVTAQDVFMPQNPLLGRVIFEQKGCIICHAISGEGGSVGSDLGEKKFYGSFLELASIMWNHLPDMLGQMRELELPFPEFSKTEIVDLTAYLYYLRYLGEPGNVYRGKVLAREKQCLSCHAIGGKGGKIGPAFDSLSKYISPLYLAQALWNHGPSMEKKLQEMGLQRPIFRKGEIVDLSAYIRTAGQSSQNRHIYMSPGNPDHGRQLFKEKKCFDCHSINGSGSDIGPDLGESEWGFSITEIAGLMWNHGSAMARSMHEKSIHYPKFNGKEMADLIAYLYFLQFKDAPGSAEKGAKLFSEKGCVQCHGPRGRKKTRAPDLSQSKALSSEFNMVQIMWNHAPTMEKRISEKMLQWPKFSGQEMRDLYAFLTSMPVTKEK